MPQLPAPRSEPDPPGAPVPPEVARLLTPEPALARRSGGRDRSLDMLRGAAVVVMVVDHLVGHSWLHQATLGTLYVTAAEGFVFCSGLALGQRCAQRLARSGLGGVATAAWRRALLLWGCASVLLVAVGTLAWAVPGAGRPVFEAPPPGLLQLWVGALTLQLAPPLLDILPMYVGFLALTPFLAALAARGAWPIALGLSALAWGVNWLEPYALSTPPLDRDGRTYFPLASWQVLFVVTFLAGWHREQLTRAWAWVPPVGWALSGGLITVALAVAAGHDATLGAWPATSPERASWLAATDRSLLGPLRLMAVAAFFPLAWRGLEVGGERLAAWLGPALLPLGRHALYAYLMHIPLVLGWTAWVAPRLGGQAWLATLGQLAVVAALIAMVRRRWLFTWVPS
ncbi:MAG: OpgC domain-containing protein [Candidatus Sericytochromatia bacterium]|nr:OpgC domain-containing protein [Candidatus Sericytochromatia bacterium]